MNTTKSERPKTYYELLKESAETYQELFSFFKQEHNLLLLQGEMDDIIAEVGRFKAKANASEKPDSHKSAVNALVSDNKTDKCDE